jgi:hypothetical protein
MALHHIQRRRHHSRPDVCVCILRHHLPTDGRTLEHHQFPHTQCRNIRCLVVVLKCLQCPTDIDVQRNNYGINVSLHARLKHNDHSVYQWNFVLPRNVRGAHGYNWTDGRCGFNGHNRANRTNRSRSNRTNWRCINRHRPNRSIRHRTHRSRHEYNSYRYFDGGWCVNCDRSRRRSDGIVHEQ